MKGSYKILIILIISLVLNISSVFAQSYTIKEPINKPSFFILNTQYKAVAYCQLENYYYIDITWDDLFYTFEYNKKGINDINLTNNISLFKIYSFTEYFFQYHTKLLNEINNNLPIVIVENKSCFNINVNASIKDNYKMKIANDNNNKLFFGNSVSKNNLANKKTTSFAVKNELQRYGATADGEVKLVFTKND
jgi:hypothetical protein